MRSGVPYQPPCTLKSITSRAGSCDSDIDNPDDIEGAPSGIQIIGRPMRDEELVHTMDIVEKALRSYR